jgi:hypothetical protein
MEGLGKLKKKIQLHHHELVVVLVVVVAAVSLFAGILPS